jgi:hypothetical protein
MIEIRHMQGLPARAIFRGQARHIHLSIEADIEQPRYTDASPRNGGQMERERCPKAGDKALPKPPMYC